MAQYGVGQGLDYGGGFGGAKPQSGFQGLLGGQADYGAQPVSPFGGQSGQKMQVADYGGGDRGFDLLNQQSKPEPAYERFPMQQPGNSEFGHSQGQPPVSQMGPGSQYQQQAPGDFTTPWTGGFPGEGRKKRFPWQQDYEQPQGGMGGMQSGPGYMQQGAPWLDGNHMQGIQRRGTPQWQG
jgi:hypothetical protein